MQPRKTKIEAFHDFLSEELNISCVTVNDGFIVVRRCCSNCEYYMTDKTKYCFSPSSIGCGQFKYLKGGKL